MKGRNCNNVGLNWYGEGKGGDGRMDRDGGKELEEEEEEVDGLCGIMVGVMWIMQMR